MYKCAYSWDEAEITILKIEPNTQISNIKWFLHMPKVWKLFKHQPHGVRQQEYAM